ncbi:pleckstrin-likey domain-containing family F member 2 isoform X2, partial [Sigmodon hispidus]
MGENALLHGKTLFAVPTTDSDHLTLPLFTQSISSHFCCHALLMDGTKLAFIVDF